MEFQPEFSIQLGIPIPMKMRPCKFGRVGRLFWDYRPQMLRKCLIQIWSFGQSTHTAKFAWTHLNGDKLGRVRCNHFITRIGVQSSRGGEFWVCGIFGFPPPPSPVNNDRSLSLAFAFTSLLDLCLKESSFPERFDSKRIQFPATKSFTCFLNWPLLFLQLSLQALSIVGNYYFPSCTRRSVLVLLSEYRYCLMGLSYQQIGSLEGKGHK